MPWIYLLLAGLFEIGFALGMKYSEGFSKPLPTAATVVSALISLYLMSQAMKSIPVGTAYAIWTGIGAMGVAVLMTFLMFLTPVLYAKPTTGILASVTEFNPLYYLVSAPRDLMLMGTIPEWNGFLVASLMSVIIFVMCLVVFHLTETRVAERI